MKHSLTLILVLSASLFFACGPVHEGSAISPPDNEDTSQAEGDILSFVEIKKQILKPYCISCHTGKHVTYENYPVVKLSLAKIKFRVTHATKPMPPNNGGILQLPDSLEKKLLTWINAGAPEKGMVSDIEPVSKVSFVDIKTKILQKKCIGCHTQYNDYVPVKRDLGAIFGAVSSDRMPFPKKKGEAVKALTKKQKDFLTEWVNAGAPEFSGGTEPALPPVILKPNWISLRNNVFGPKCIICHNSFAPRGPSFMGTHLELRKWATKYKASNKADLFNFKDPNKSHFVGAILGRINEEELFFDPMPFNTPADDVSDISAVTKDELKVIEKWIELELPFNEDDK